VSTLDWKSLNALVAPGRAYPKHARTARGSRPAPQPMDLLFMRPLPRWKRAVDLLGAVAGLTLFAVPMLIIALAIKLTSPGPVFFSQFRTGHGGKPFRLFKFRTMVVDAEERKQELLRFNMRQGPAFKMKNDPRVTRLGVFLRKSSLDELPQFFNVLIGDMTLVGPRPLPLKEECDLVAWHRARRVVCPGITCIWQVTSRDETCFDQWMRQDMQYVREQSFWLDTRLLLLTLPAVLIRKGALE
jgi:lipopolysaccharide/colanic/teichoic acid biosynthesis glycosyltransferase